MHGKCKKAAARDFATAVESHFTIRFHAQDSPPYSSLYDSSIFIQ
ncbi:hypothetical protein GCM10027286_20030 [Virgibacillus ainsalahensis]